MERDERFIEQQKDWFRQIHRHPELGNREVRTTELVREILDANGIRHRSCPTPTGAIAEIGGGNGPVVGIRADIDALPVQEQTDLSYASEVPGVMHACGHDFHTAAVLGAALMLKKMEHELPGRAVIIFQPAEEITTGGRQMARSGITDDVDVFMAIHTYPFFEAGTVGIRDGAVMAAVDQFTITLTGLGGHAGYPHKTIDPIPPLAELTMALQTVVSRRNSPFDEALLSITHLEAGNTWNVIPETAVMEGTVRTLDPAVRERMHEDILRICEGICAANKVAFHVTWNEGPPALYNDADLCRMAREEAASMGLKVDRQEDTMGGEDFAEFLCWPRKRPGLFIRIGTGGGIANHHPKFTVDPTALFPASCLLRNMALRLMRETR